jgi:putative transposase
LKRSKRGSSKWIKTQGPAFRRFHWQSGYGGFSIGQSAVDEVTTYIAQQAEHHRKKTFQEEFRVFLRRYEIEYNEQYVWD